MEPQEENRAKSQTNNTDSDDESINPLENCRDFNQVNKSNLTVKANLLSLVSQDGITGKCIFKNTLIKILIQLKVVPVAKNSLYRLTDLYENCE